MPNQEKRTIILLHDFFESGDSLKALGRELSDDYRVEILNLPGYGNIEPLRVTNLDSYADWLHEYIVNAKIQMPILLGNSFGGVLASYYATKYGAEVDRKIILLSPIFRSEKTQKSMVSLARVYAAFCLLLPMSLLKNDKAADFIYRRFTTKRDDFNLAKWIMGSGVCDFNSKKAFVQNLKTYLSEQTRVTYGKKALFCVGEHDKKLDTQLISAHADKFNAEMALIKNASHFVAYEKPKNTAQAIREFLNND